MNSEHLVAIVSFEREVKRLREVLRRVETLSSFAFKVRAYGHVHTGDVKVSFELAPNDYGAEPVKGDALHAVLDELLRRHGWKQVHDPKALSYDKIPSDDTADDAIPL